jgi:hypothetical protein
MNLNPGHLPTYKTLFPVLRTQTGALEQVHFDTRQYNHILWEEENELKEALYNFICAIIGKRANS